MHGQNFELNFFLKTNVTDKKLQNKGGLEYMDNLKGINYLEWVKIRRIIDTYFDIKLKELINNIEIDDENLLEKIKQDNPYSL